MHTPGPWEAVSLSIRSNAPTKSGGWGCLVATAASFLQSDAVNSPAQEQANAQLIAKAPELLALVDELTVELHKVRVSLIHEFSGDWNKDLRKVREEINAIRARAGLGPSPVEPTYPEEEEGF